MTYQSFMNMNILISDELLQSLPTIFFILLSILTLVYLYFLLHRTAIS